MCFPFDAIVPELPAGFRVDRRRRGRRAPHADVRRRHRVLAPTSPAPTGPTGVVVLPDVRGLFRFYEQLAERFAAAGHPAIAIDYFGRTAGLGPRDEDFEYMPHVQQTTPETVALDVAAALARCASDRRRARDHRRLLLRRRAVVHAGRRGPRGPGRRRRLLRLARARRASAGRSTARPRRKVPVLGLFAGDDENITARPGRRVRRGAAGRARDPHLRGRAALVLRPPPGAVRGRIPGRVGAHPGIHRSDVSRSTVG